MAANILVISYDSPIGEFIRQALEEDGKYKLHVTRGIKQSVTFLLETDCTLALIDPGEHRASIPPLLRRLRETRPALKVILLAEAGWQELLEELEPDGTLYKPFSLPELLQAVEKIIPPEEKSPLPEEPAREEKLPAWLSNVNRAARRLTQLSVESASQGALITNADQLWAYAGQLPRQAARELAATVIRYWDREEQNDLVRFVRLVSTEAEHMLYATRLAANMVLALVFDAETPYSMIRSQAGQLKHTLSMVADEGDMTEGVAPTPPNPLRSFLAQVTSPSAPAETSTEKPGENEKEAQMEDAIRRLFLSPPPGETDEASRQVGANTIAPVSAPALFQRFSINSGKLEAQPDTSPKPDTGQVDTEPGFEPEEDGSQGSLPVPRRLVLEPATASVYNLDYVCLLIPRLSHNLMTGDLSERLGDWLPQICQAFYWRLEYLSIRPEYIQWIANVPPATSPAYFMRILRQLTSEKIFLEFPRYKRENPSGDFWAPGYLIMGGSQPPPSQLIKDYIAQTRQRQGGSQTFEN